MSRPEARAYSRHTLEALALLGRQLRLARMERKMPASELAQRAGISRGLLQRIENGDPRCEIGVAFELATLLGLPLFDAAGLTGHIQRLDDRLALLPRYARPAGQDVDDDF